MQSSRRDFLKSLAVLGMTGGTLALSKDGTAQAKENPRPNVLFISIDDLNDWVGCLGGHPQAQTPHIDRLARQGTLFTNAHCQAPVCQPSRASLMTSRWPSSTGLYFLNPPLAASPTLKDSKTLPERFAQEGYEVMGAGKLYHGGENKKYFSKAGIYGGNFGGFGPRADKKISYPIGHPLWDWGAFPDRDEKMPDSKIAKWAIQQLNTQHEKPFFLGIGFYRPHVPMLVPQKWFDMHPQENIRLPDILANDMEDIPAYAKDLTTLEHVSPTHEWMKEHHEWKHAVQAYLACCTFVDHYVGQVVKALEASPYKNNTLIVLFSDHGFHLGEKNHWAKRTLWEDGTRVPVVIAGAGCPSGQVCARPVGLIDLYPTLLDLCGLQADSSLEGTTLRPLLNDPKMEWKRPALTFFGAGNASVRSDHWRYIRYKDGSQELYDHRKDPHEWYNLASDSRYAQVIRDHARWIPKNYYPILGEGSTGHKAYQAANQNLKRQD